MTATIFDVRDYGAACDGTTDDAAAVQRAVDAAEAAGSGEVRAHVAHRLSQPIVIPQGVTLSGDGKNVAWFLPESRNIDAIQFSPAHGVTTTNGVNLSRAENATVTLRDFSIQYPALVLPELINGKRQYSDSGKYAIRMKAHDDGSGTPAEPAANITQPTISNVSIVNAPNGILISNALGGLIDNCLIDNFEVVGIEIASPESPDGGGVNISRTPIVNYQGWPNHLELQRGTGIVWRSGGGLKVLDCGMACVNDGIRTITEGNTSQFMVSRVSFDTFFNVAVRLSRNQSFPNARLTVIKITDNEFSGPNAIYADPDETKWLSDVICDANIYRGSASAAVAQVYLDGVDGASVRNGFHRSNISGTVAVILGAHTSNVRYGRNIKEPAGLFSADQDYGTGNTALGAP